MNGQTAAALADLLHADRALLAMYDDVADRISAETASLLQDAIEDHRRHEAVLSRALEDAEMQRTDASDDMLELLNEHTRQLRSARDERQLLGVLSLAERLNAMLYETVQREELPEELEELVAEHHADERMHASLITERAAAVPWGAEHNIACLTGGMTDDRNPDDFE